MPLEPVSFLTVENGEDLIVSFAIALGEPGEVASLILLRSLKDEMLLPVDERGVGVSHELHPETEEDRLLHIRLTPGRVEIDATSRSYALGVSRVDPDELREAKEVLKRMNFDRRFRLDLG